MENIIMAISITPRSVSSTQVQSLLTKHGCIISTRLGLHEISDNYCSENGLIILHIYSEINEVRELESDLLKIDGVKVKYMTI